MYGEIIFFWVCGGIGLVAYMVLRIAEDRELTEKDYANLSEIISSAEETLTMIEEPRANKELSAPELNSTVAFLLEESVVEAKEEIKESELNKEPSIPKLDSIPAFNASTFKAGPSPVVEDAICISQEEEEVVVDTPSNEDNVEVAALDLDSLANAMASF